MAVTPKRGNPALSMVAGGPDRRDRAGEFGRGAGGWLATIWVMPAVALASLASLHFARLPLERWLVPWWR
jgi:hypothetical protein